jgi:hypothetical protein
LRNGFLLQKYIGLNNRMKTVEKLLEQFLATAKSLHADINPIKILKSNTFQIGKSNVLVRTASELGKRYFFGLNYLTAEEIYNLENAYFAFICGDIEQAVMLPADVLIELLPQISHDRNGEYKINFTRDLELVLRGRGNHHSCDKYINNWKSMISSEAVNVALISPDESIHNVIQGRLIEIGNIRGYQTYCPDKSKTFNKRKLIDVASLKSCPELQYADHDSLRKIDVVWFREVSKGFYPEYAFEVEISTGVWSGFGRLASLKEYNTRLYIVTNEEKRFKQVSSSFPEYSSRYIHVIPDKVGLLYSAELSLIKMREEFNL